jgi:hypothetical protein
MLAKIREFFQELFSPVTPQCNSTLEATTTSLTQKTKDNEVKGGF